jgi:putative NIF3 family GTP cyclohydrolase 1 type 2
VGAGSCGDLFEAAAKQGATFFLTGEIRHHDALAAARLGLTVVATLHSNSERVTLRHLAAKVAEALPGIVCHLSAADADPLRVVAPNG